MNQRPVLYIGVATPLVEVANVWLAEIPPCDDETARREKLRAFPRDKIGAYDLSLPDHSALAFSTGMPVSRERVQAEVEAWSGKSPQLINTIEDPVNPLDHRSWRNSNGR